jgi:hypothetical protein
MTRYKQGSIVALGLRKLFVWDCCGSAFGGGRMRDLAVTDFEVAVIGMAIAQAIILTGSARTRRPAAAPGPHRANGVVTRLELFCYLPRGIPPPSVGPSSA